VQNSKKIIKQIINYIKSNWNMTKAELVADVASKTGVDKSTVFTVVESFMTVVKDSLAKKDNVYLRGFGSFIIKERAQKTGRNISKNTTLVIPAHKIPAFKPAKSFSATIKTKLK
jgi:DNA-binding protein HU-beta